MLCTLRRLKDNGQKLNSTDVWLDSPINRVIDYVISEDQVSCDCGVSSSLMLFDLQSNFLLLASYSLHKQELFFMKKGHILFFLVNFIINKARKLKKLAFAVEVCVFPHRKVRHLNMERCTEMHKNVMFFVIELS